MSGLEIEGLRVSIGNRDVVRAVDLHVEPGTCAGLVGESGSGKSLTALASLGLLPRMARVTAGRILIADDETVTADRDHSAQVRGSGIHDLPVASCGPKSCAPCRVPGRARAASQRAAR